MMDAIARIPMGVRVAILAVAVGLAFAATVAHDDRSSGEGGAAGAMPHSSHLGARVGGGSWMPSRPERHSVVWAIGDGADGGSASRAVATMVASRRADRLLYLGDVYETGTSAEFQSNYRPAYGRFDSITAPTIGNHEWPNVATGYVPYWSSVRGAPPPLWYAFAVSGWQLISLDSNLPTSPDQLGWLRNEIRSTPRYGNCRIVFMHHPFFSAGLHGDLTALQSVFGELRGHATIALAGHDHDMQRLRRVNGITQFVEGAGGRDLYPVNSGDPRLAFFDDTHHGALRLGLRPGAATASFIAREGTTLDSSSVRCRQSAR